MSTLASLRILLGLDASGVKAGGAVVRGELQTLQADANRASATFGGLGKSLALGLGIGTGIAALHELGNVFGQSVNAARDLSESLSKSQVVFGQSARAVEAFGTDAARNLGLSKQAAIEAAATFGNLFTTMGLGKDAVRDMSIDIVSLAGDLASFNNIGTDEALLKLRSGLVGEAEPLRTLGVQLTEATVKAKAMALGLADANGNLSESAKVQARYALILEQTKTAQGDFARTSGGLANLQRINTAEWENAQAVLGEKLLPAMIGLAHIMSDTVIPAVSVLADHVDALAPVLEGIAIVLAGKLAISLAGSALGFVASGAAALGFGTATAVAATEAEVSAGRIAAAGVTAKAGWLGIMGPAVIPVVALVALREEYEKAAVAGRKLAADGGGGADSAAAGAAELARQTAILTAARDNGSISQATYDAGIQKLRASFGDERLAAGEAAAATETMNKNLALGTATAQAAAQALLTTTEHADKLGASISTAAGAVTGQGAAMDQAARAALALTVAVGTSANATKEQKQAASDAMAVFKQLGTVFDGFNGVVDEGAAASDHFGFANRAAMDLASEGMRGAYKTAADLKDSINAIPDSKSISITITTRTLAEGVGAANVAEKSAAAADVAAGTDTSGEQARLRAQNAADFAADQAARKAERDRNAAAAKADRDRAAREAQSAADTAAREAEQKARDSARQQASDYRDAMSAAYDKISADAHKVFDAVHAANLKIIRDAQDTANAQIEAQEKAIRGFVTGEQAKLDAERSHRRELELRADVANAVSPEDRARAQQSLNDFLADQRIAFLSAQADTQVAALDAAKAANDATAAAQTQAENDRFKQQTTEFDKTLKALEDGLKKHPELWKSSQENVLKLLLKYDVDYQKAGTAAGKAYADGLLATSLAVEQAARGVAVAGARAEGNVVVAPPVVPVVPTPQQSTDASYAAVTAGYSKSPAPERSVQSQITPMGEWVGGGKAGDVYLFGEIVGELLAKHGATLDAIYNPVPVSIGPKR